MEELDQDRLSSLPKMILHCILSKLPEKDAVRTSVLSKDWLDTWYTFPILSFKGKSLAQPMQDIEKMRKSLEFCDYVKRTILRFHDQSLAIKEFKLQVNSGHDDCISIDVETWLKLACECGVEVIDYSHCKSRNQDQYHVLPMCVIEAKSLTKLALEWYIKIDPTFMNHSIKFTSLRVLSMRCVLLGDQHVINHLISFCRLIESITLRGCFVIGSGDGTKEKLKSLSISGLQKLKSVEVVGIPDVSIDAPSLENLCYSPNDFDAPLKIDFDRCRNLKELCMWSMKSLSTFFTDKWFLEQFPKFSFLESLKLYNCKTTERIDISSVRLKVLVLSKCSNLKEINIDAPNLLLCRYKGVLEPTISFLRNSSQLAVNIQIHVEYVADLCNLREFVQNIKPNNVLTSLSLSIRIASNMDAYALDPVALYISSPPPSIKHLTILNVPKNQYLFPSVVNILHASCCPTTISLNIYSGGKEFVKFFYETLMRIKEDKCCCGFYDTKCCWQHLKDVKVTSPMKMDENVDFKTILNSLTTSESIRFRLEF